MALAVANHLWDLPAGGSSEGQRTYFSVALAAVDLLGRHQTVVSSEVQSSCCPVCSFSPARVYGLWVLFPKGSNCRETSGLA